MDARNLGLHKRQQIIKANRMMFLWVAGASVVVGFALVIALFLGQKIWFGERVLSEKANTIATLDKDTKAIPALQDSIRVLDTDEGLKAVRLSENERPIQTVLDALPAVANSTALGASLQSKLLAGINGLTIDTIKVDPVVGIETQHSSDSNVVDASPSLVDTSGDNTIHFSLTVSTAASNPDALGAVLIRLEKSIRAIDVRSLAITSQGSRLILTVSGQAYYQPARTVELKDKVVRP